MPELVLSQEMSAGPARLRVDVLGGPARGSIVNDMDFLNYRLAAVTMEDAVTVDQPDVIWNVDADTDIIAASAQAYLAALNRLTYSRSSIAAVGEPTHGARRLEARHARRPPRGCA